MTFRGWSDWQRLGRYLAIALLSLGICAAYPALSIPMLASPPPSGATEAMQSGDALMQQSRTEYEAEQFQAAIVSLQQAIHMYRAQSDPLGEAIALSNLALVHQSLHQWPEANRAIAQSLTLLETITVSPDTQRALAQAYEIRGQIELAQGQAENALTAWQQATTLYTQLGLVQEVLQNQLNQAQALQILGFYRQAIALLTEANQTLSQQPDSRLKATGLQQLGEALLAAGDPVQAQTVLQQSLTIAQSANDSEAIAATLLSLGQAARLEAMAALSLNTLSAKEAVLLLQPTTRGGPRISYSQRQREGAIAFQRSLTQALELYRQALQYPLSSLAQTRIELAQLQVLVDLQDWAQVQQVYAQIAPRLQASGDALTGEDAVRVAQTVITWQSSDPNPTLQPLETVENLLARVAQQAKQVGDRRTQSYALGTLGNLYEQQQNRTAAKQTTEDALAIAQSIPANDIVYRWEWQLGRVTQADSEMEQAIAHYTEAVNTLQALRQDLAAMNRDAQFSFRESVEPVYRQLVDLLLQEADSEQQTARLAEARRVIEALQIAELDNFFREACLDTAFQLDQVVDDTASAVVFYTIVLSDRLEVILKLPHQPLQHYATPVPQADVEQTASEFLDYLRRPYSTPAFRSTASRLYDWLIRPAEPWLRDYPDATLVFVPDGVLRNIPMAALYDGQQYLLERYSVAIAPGLQLRNPRSLAQQDLRVLVAGLSEARNQFPPLQNVETEVEGIRDALPGEVLFNQGFTRANLELALGRSPFSVVHVATHGQFSSNVADTFLLAWDAPIDINDLQQLLQDQEIEQTDPIELLVLSACQTAVGDRRATLGLAGMAVRAGARSTIASLWNLDDASGAALMRFFYSELSQHPASRAEALRQAQLALLHDPQFSTPRFWAPYVLLGNWL